MISLNNNDLNKKTKLIKEELWKRFAESTAEDKSIVITMKIDNQYFKIVPEWLFGQDEEIELANGFDVFTKVESGMATAPFMSALNLDELAYNIAIYRGMMYARSCMPMYLYVEDTYGLIQMVEYHKYY